MIIVHDGPIEVGTEFIVHVNEVDEQDRPLQFTRGEVISLLLANKRDRIYARILDIGEFLSEDLYTCPALKVVRLPD